MRRVRGCEILAAPLALALLVATGLGFGGVAASPAPADEPRPAHADFVGELTQVHAIPPAGSGSHPTVGKFVAVVPVADDAGDGPIRTERAPAVAGNPAISAPLPRSARAPPPLRRS